MSVCVCVCACVRGEFPANIIGKDLLAICVRACVCVGVCMHIEGYRQTSSGACQRRLANIMFECVYVCVCMCVCVYVCVCVCVNT